MVRTFSAESLVALPKFNVDAGLALWQEIQAVIQGEKKLPKFLQAVWQNLEQAGIDLSKAAQSRLTGSSVKTPLSPKRQADQTIDRAMGALDRYLEAWTLLPFDPAEGQLARAVRQALFPDGKGFLKLPYKQQWAQVERRMNLIKSEGLDKQVAQLGGARFISIIQQAHQAYGKALGLTSPAELAENVTLREPLETLVTALRRYVIKVTAYGDDEDPAAAALAERLLRPIVAWTTTVPRSSGGGKSDPDPTPGSGGEPGPAPTSTPGGG